MKVKRPLVSGGGPLEPRPTDVIGATQTEDAALLARAKQTVYALNKYQALPWARLSPTQDCSLSPVLRGAYQGFATLFAV